MSIMSILESREYQLMHEDLLGNEIDKLVNEGFYALIMCLGGIAISPFITLRCIKKEIPSAYYANGLYHLDRKLCFDDTVKAVDSLKKIPSIVITMDELTFSHILSNTYKLISQFKNVSYYPGDEYSVVSKVSENYKKS